MARRRPSFHSTIEYIGPRPEKPKRRPFFGGWVILVIALGVGGWAIRPLVPHLKATQQGPSLEQADLLISSLRATSDTGCRLAAAALAYSHEDVVHDSAYYKITYPNGDIPSHKGAAADVIIRCFRGLGIDLQQELHEDMTAEFRPYPQLFGARAPDTNIDHRRVPNLERFFERKGEVLTPSREAADYRPGDIVVWSLGDAEKHIGIIVPGPGDRAGQPWVVHHKDSRVKWEDVLFDFQIDSHFRYPKQDEN